MIRGRARCASYPAARRVQELGGLRRGGGASLDQAVRVGVYLRDFAEMNQIYAQYLKGDNPPVRTTIPVALDGMAIEVDAILYLG